MVLPRESVDATEQTVDGIVGTAFSVHAITIRDLGVVKRRRSSDMEQYI